MVLFCECACDGAHGCVGMCSCEGLRISFGIVLQVPSTLAFVDRVSTGLKAGWTAWLASPRDQPVSASSVLGLQGHAQHLALQ